MFRTLIAALFFLVSILPIAALAAQPSDKLVAILEQQRALQADLVAGQDLGLTRRQLGIVGKAQAEVFSLTDGRTSMDQLNIEERVRLENALERINAQVKGGDRAAQGEQEVCWRERRSGSSLKVTRCGTQAERDRLREGARDWMERPSICTPPGCGQ